MSWTPEIISAFVGGCFLGAFLSFLITCFILFANFAEEKKNMEEKYKALRLECNALERKNYKLIAFIKDRRWEDG